MTDIGSTTYSERSEPARDVGQEARLRARSKLRYPVCRILSVLLQNNARRCQHTVLATGRRRHRSHLRQRRSEGKGAKPCRKIYPDRASETAIGQREGVRQQQRHPGRHGSRRQSQYRQRLEVAAQLLRTPHARHVPGVVVVASGHTGGVDAHAIVGARRAVHDGLSEAFAGLHLVGRW